MMSNDVPLLVCLPFLTLWHIIHCSLQVSYEFNQGHIRYYLAPKIGDD